MAIPDAAEDALATPAPPVTVTTTVTTSTTYVVPAPREAPPDGEQTTLGTRRGRTILTGFTTAHFSHHVSNSLLNPLLPFIRDAFGLTYGQSGLLVSAFAMSLGLSNAPIGYLADRFGARLVVVAGLFLTGLISVVVGMAGSYWQL